jgi:plastocyanin
MVLASLLPAGVASGDGRAEVPVQVVNFAYNPLSVTIAQGDRVNWTWVSGTHTVTNAPNSTESYDSGPKSSGSYVRQFDNVGTFYYFCTVHGASMWGRVIVGAVGPELGPMPFAGAAFALLLGVTLMLRRSRNAPADDPL